MIIHKQGNYLRQLLASNLPNGLKLTCGDFEVKFRIMKKQFNMTKPESETAKGCRFDALVIFFLR